ncbi:hypothetical protein DFJ73DRAFT_793778 [Zopfochytrium polystomum]|nr:hypothetical protein DFJ73DRAFT_793778 [Zopfochytrium polystomum]
MIAPPAPKEEIKASAPNASFLAATPVGSSGRADHVQERTLESPPLLDAESKPLRGIERQEQVLDQACALTKLTVANLPAQVFWRGGLNEASFGAIFTMAVVALLAPDEQVYSEITVGGKYADLAIVGKDGDVRVIEFKYIQTPYIVGVDYRSIGVRGGEGISNLRELESVVSRFKSVGPTFLQSQFWTLIKKTEKSRKERKTTKVAKTFKEALHQVLEYVSVLRNGDGHSLPFQFDRRNVHCTVVIGVSSNLFKSGVTADSREGDAARFSALPVASPEAPVPLRGRTRVDELLYICRRLCKQSLARQRSTNFWKNGVNNAGFKGMVAAALLMHKRSDESFECVPRPRHDGEFDIAVKTGDGAMLVVSPRYVPMVGLAEVPTRNLEYWENKKMMIAKFRNRLDEAAGRFRRMSDDDLKRQSFYGSTRTVRSIYDDAVRHVHLHANSPPFSARGEELFGAALVGVASNVLSSGLVPISNAVTA